ncbi:hypothetical protein [Actinoplanes auranticolor]|nr:hypothetical protein [Actinoplanes auranticolor]
MSILVLGDAAMSGAKAFTLVPAGRAAKGRNLARHRSDESAGLDTANVI